MGPIWSQKMKGPTRRWRIEGSARRTGKPPISRGRPGRRENIASKASHGWHKDRKHKRRADELRSPRAASGTLRRRLAGREQTSDGPRTPRSGRNLSCVAASSVVRRSGANRTSPYLHGSRSARSKEALHRFPHGFMPTRSCSARRAEEHPPVRGRRRSLPAPDGSTPEAWRRSLSEAERAHPGSPWASIGSLRSSV
jgi:hypothetical protein